MIDQAVPVTKSAARRYLLARSGLLCWSAAGGSEPGCGVPWRNELRGSAGVLEAIRRLEAVQLDPVAVVARNHHLVLWNRVGGYRPEHLETLYQDRRVFEYLANARCILPIEALPAARLIMVQEDAVSAAWRERLAGAVEQVLKRLREDGPLPSRQIESGKRISGYWDHPDTTTTKATSQALEHLWEVGEVTVALRKGDERHFHLTERWLGGPLPPPAPGGWDELLAAYERACGIFDPGDPRFGWRRLAAAGRREVIARRVAAGELIPLQVEGTRRSYYMQARELPLLQALESADVADELYLLPPLDNLLWRRSRIADFFNFDYTWEIYMPGEKRRFGAYAMPILEGDRLIGRLDPRCFREKGLLRINRIALEPGVRPTAARLNRIAAAVLKLAHFTNAASVESAPVEPGGKRLPL